VLCLCVTGVFLLLLHGSSPPLEAEEGKKEAAAVRSREEALVVQAEVEEAPLPPGNARVAFLFIARNRLPLDLVWDAFFRVRSPHAPPRPAFHLECTNAGLAKSQIDRAGCDSYQGDDDGRFSIFVHSRPGFVLTRATTRSRFFYNRQVNNSVQVSASNSQPYDLHIQRCDMIFCFLIYLPFRWIGGRRA
jgi:hypothetical protein